MSEAVHHGCPGAAKPEARCWQRPGRAAAGPRRLLPAPAGRFLIGGPSPTAALPCVAFRPFPERVLALPTGKSQAGRAGASRNSTWQRGASLWILRERASAGRTGRKVPARPHRTATSNPCSPRPAVYPVQFSRPPLPPQPELWWPLSLVPAPAAVTAGACACSSYSGHGGQQESLRRWPRRGQKVRADVRPRAPRAAARLRPGHRRRRRCRWLSACRC